MHTQCENWRGKWPISASFKAGFVHWSRRSWSARQNSFCFVHLTARDEGAWKEEAEEEEVDGGKGFQVSW